MKKSYLVDELNSEMRIDRWIRNKLGKFPQSLIEKNLRNGKIKINNKKIKSSHKVNAGDTINLFNISYEKKNLSIKNKFIP